MIAGRIRRAVVQINLPDVLYAAICHVARRQSEVHADDVLPLVKVKPRTQIRGKRLEARNEGRRPARRSGAAPCLTDPVSKASRLPCVPLGCLPREGGVTSETFLDGRVTLHIGDVRAKLRELPCRSLRLRGDFASVLGLAGLRDWTLGRRRPGLRSSLADHAGRSE
jgi:hypothetical protein